MTSSGTYSQRYRQLTADRARARRVARLRVLLAPYSVRQVVVPLQRRRVVRSEVTA